MLSALNWLRAVEYLLFLRKCCMIGSLISLNDTHELLIHLTLLFILFSRDFLHIFFLLLVELFLTEVLGSALLPEFVQLLLFLRNVLLSVQETGRGQDLVDSLDVGACTIFCVELRPHVYVWIYFKVHLRQVAVVAQPEASVLQIVVSEKASINMLAKKFAQLKNELILQHLYLIKDINVWLKRLDNLPSI